MQTAAAAGNVTDRGPRYAEPQRDLAMRKLAVFQQAINF